MASTGHGGTTEGTMSNPVISSVTLPTGSTYDFKDAWARDAIETIQQYGSYLGVTTTPLTDGATTNPVKINGEDVTAVIGSIVNYGSKEFIFNGTVWQEFGDLSALGDLAYADTASGSFTPAGTVSQPTFSGTAATIKPKVTAEGTVSISTGTGTANYTPAGTVSQPTFSGTSKAVSVKGTATGNVTIGTGSGTANYTPAGTVSQPSFTGTQGSISVTGTPAGSVAISIGTGTANYTPAGTVSTPTITVTPNTGSVTPISAVGTLPAWSATVTGENLTFAWDTGTLPTKGTAVSVVTSIKSATSTQPTFTGTGAQIVGDFTGTSLTSTGSFTPSGTVSQPSFSGTGANLTASFTGTEFTSSGSFKPEGTVTQPTFTGTGAKLEATFTGTEVEGTASYTPAGTVSKPSFTGTAGTVTVGPTD